MNQECIPVGCVPTAAVITTRCQYGGGRPLGRNMGPDSRPLEGTWYQPDRKWRHTPPGQNDTRFWKHYLPLRSVKMKKILYRSQWQLVTFELATVRHSVTLSKVSFFRRFFDSLQNIALYFIMKENTCQLCVAPHMILWLYFCGPCHRNFGGHFGQLLDSWYCRVYLLVKNQNGSESFVFELQSISWIYLIYKNFSWTYLIYKNFEIKEFFLGPLW